jgi:hypothetical protein
MKHIISKLDSRELFRNPIPLCSSTLINTQMSMSPTNTSLSLNLLFTRNSSLEIGNNKVDSRVR